MKDMVTRLDICDQLVAGFGLHKCCIDGGGVGDLDLHGGIMLGRRLGVGDGKSNNFAITGAQVS
jgi:hypothetical protein